MQAGDRTASEREAKTAAQLGFGHLFDRVRDAVVVADGDGRIVLWNPSAALMFGYSAEEARGRDVALLVPARLRARHDAGMRNFRAHHTGTFLRSGSVLELPALRKDGREIVVEMTLSHLEGGGNFVMAILRDVTERVQLRQAVDADRQHLREANESLESFAYVVGHDLKEPVRAVDAYLEAIAGATQSAEELALLEKARDANRRMRTLLEGLIEWGRATTSAEDAVPVDIGRTILAGACRARYQHILDERHAAIDIAGSIPPVLATENLICQIFGNLILNAIRHNPADQPRVSLAPLGVRKGLVGIGVRDNGPGFPPEVRQRVEKMRATRPTTVRGGFGLTIAIRAAHILSGTLEVGSAPGGGAEVRVWLPLAEENGPIDTQPTAMSP